MNEEPRTDASGQEQQLAQTTTTQSGAILDQALKGVAQTNDKPILGDEKIAQQFASLPMRELIAGPLIAAAEAQEKLASTALRFYEHIAFEDNKKTRIVEFEVERPVEEEGKMVFKKQTIKAPFIGLVPIPALLIDRIDVDFQMEVSASAQSKETTASEASTDISAKWFCVNASVHGKVSSSRENTRSSNQTAKYQVHVSASQQKQTEGLSKLIDIMASCIEPMPVSTTPAPAPAPTPTPA